MDSIEKMRRINELTKELKQRGFADSSFEAIQQANQIYGTDELDDNVKNGIIPNSAHEKVAAGPDESIPYTDRQFAKLRGSIDTLTTKMNEIVRAINDLDVRVSDIRTKQEKMASMAAQVRIETRPEVKQEQKSDSKVESSEPKVESTSHSDAPAQAKDEYSLNQRTGSYQSQDVSIDKMFYFGKKK